MRIEHSIDIAAPVERLWSLTTDIERWPSLFRTVISVERLDGGPVVVGSRARLRQPGQRPRVWTVTHLDAPTHFEWTSSIGPVRMAGIHRLESLGAGCRNHLAIELNGPMSRLLGRLAGRQIHRALAIENEGFRSAAESG